MVGHERTVSGGDDVELVTQKGVIPISLNSVLNAYI
jgi:hypothetical protein